MRKIAACILAIMMLLCSTMGISEESVIDFSVYSLDELVSIRNELEREIMSRVEYKTPDMIYRGKYVVGKDIKAGQYIFTCTEAWMGSSSPEGYIATRRLSEDGSKDVCAFYTDYLAPGNSVFIVLDQGMLLEVRDCSGTLVVRNQSWAVDNEK